MGPEEKLFFIVEDREMVVKGVYKQESTLGEDVCRIRPLDDALE